MRWRSRTRGRVAARFRRAILRRDGYRCRTCRGAGRLEVHHPKPVHLGGRERDPANAETLCRVCHLAHHADERDVHPDLAAWRHFLKHS